MATKKLIKIWQIDSDYRDIGNCENQFRVMEYALNFLTDEQLNLLKRFTYIVKKNDQREEA